MTWILLGLSAGLVLGTYDFLTKLALKEKAVLEVVFLSSILGGLVWTPYFFLPAGTWKVVELSIEEQLVLLPKSVMMVATWVLSYYSVKALPLSISAGVRASGPLWTAFGAILFLSEALSWWQWLGLLVSTGAYYMFSLIGKKEGINFQKNVWVLCMVVATILSSANALYDKHIVAGVRMDLAAIQAYSAVQRSAVALVFLPWVFRNLEFRSMLGRNWAVPAIAIAYVVAELIYLAALQIDGAMISIISVLRRTNLIMVFALSTVFFTENYVRQKVAAITAVLAGILLTVLH